MREHGCLQDDRIMQGQVVLDGRVVCKVMEMVTKREFSSNG